ncbi:hypothetical protein F5883DRAFT_638839 [Diaporthe sp. PMI_573]|nr:hypothetical protein F5883DRAFT_638839 [Diaporthaceae sp. PMI_573]
MEDPSLPRAAIVICLGLSPVSQDRTMKSLAICSGVLDYLRDVQGRGCIMTVNFSGRRLLQSNSPKLAEQCIREDCEDWCDVLDAASRLVKRNAAECTELEILLVGTDEVPCRGDPASLCQAYKGNGIRINSILTDSTQPTTSPQQGSSRRTERFEVISVADPFVDPGEDAMAAGRRTRGWDMTRLARETGGLTLSPNTEGKLALHLLFGEMFRRWGEQYWRAGK